MTVVQFVKKHASRITRLERALNDLFAETRAYTSIHVEQSVFRHFRQTPSFTIKAYVETPSAWYDLEEFADMSAMIKQIKHDVKEAST